MTAGRLKAQIVLCPMGIFDLPYIFRELCSAIPEEMKEEVSSMAESLQLCRSRVEVHRQDDQSSKQISFMLSEGPSYSCNCTSHLTMRAKHLKWE
jgi:hypothetical protein